MFWKQNSAFVIVAVRAQKCSVELVTVKEFAVLFFSRLDPSMQSVSAAHTGNLVHWWNRVSETMEVLSRKGEEDRLRWASHTF